MLEMKMKQKNARANHFKMGRFQAKRTSKAEVAQCILGIADIPPKPKPGPLYTPHNKS